MKLLIYYEEASSFFSSIETSPRKRTTICPLAPTLQDRSEENVCVVRSGFEDLPTLVRLLLRSAETTSVLNHTGCAGKMWSSRGRRSIVNLLERHQQQPSAASRCPPLPGDGPSSAQNRLANQ